MSLIPIFAYHKIKRNTYVQNKKWTRKGIENQHS
jgi:hypothetical protein